MPTPTDRRPTSRVVTIRFTESSMTLPQYCRALEKAHKIADELTEPLAQLGKVL